MGTEVHVLGSLELVGDHGTVALPANKHRRLLAALAVAHGRTYSIDELLDAVWGESPPASARKLLHVYVSKLRKALPTGVSIVTGPAGYALSLDEASLDADRFEQLVEEAARAREDRNPALAAALAERALALWRGPAYADVAYDDFARGEADRLEELRLVAFEERLDARLRLGHDDTLLAEAQVVADEHPFRERLQQLVMLALYRSGRQTDALERYTTLRRRLDDELGLEPGPELRALERLILQQDPALELGAGEGPTAAALPVPPNPLIGRERELEALAGILGRGDVRLLVLTGAGGSGKTRLALAAAREAASSYANGAAFVSLAPLRDPELVGASIAHELSIAETPGQPRLASLAGALSSRELLLVLDNAEHLRAAAPMFVELLARAPRLTLLITSRTVLHLTGEQVFPVAPLDEDAAIELFAQRARALEPGFGVTQENEGLVREICRRVDGLPLAIELAAARVRALTVNAVLERLEERLQFLTGGPHDLPARQQTLRATLDWSYELLSEDERTLLRRLSVFPAGATLDAAVAVGVPDDEERAVGLLERLADASLVRPRERDGQMRYHLLETIRQYAADRLEGPELEPARQRHAEWCLALVERAEAELSGEHQARWFAILEAEHDSARVALDHLSEADAGLELRLTVALSRFWYVRGHLAEARRRLEGVLAHAAGGDLLLLRRARTATAAIALLQGDYAAATEHSEGALEAAREAGEPRFVANALSNLGAIVLAAGDHERAGVVLEEAVSLAREVGDDRIAALAINNLGDLALTTGDYRRAQPLFEESQALLRARGDTANIARSLFNLGAVELMLERPEAADAHFREGLRLADETGDLEDVAWCLEGLASLAAAAGDGTRAATLLGAAGALLDRMGASLKPFERQLHEATEQQAEQLCGHAGYRVVRAEGEALPLAQAIVLATDGRPAS